MAIASYVVMCLGYLLRMRRRNTPRRGWYHQPPRLSFTRVDMMLRSILTLALLLGPAAVLHAEQSTDQAPAVNFTDHVLPIFRQHCLQCHNANDAEAGLAIDSYGGLMEGGGSGGRSLPAVNPG